MKKIIKRTVLASLIVAKIASAATVEQPWLRQRLPEKISAYVRIPHALFPFAEVQTPLQPLYQKPEYSQQVIAMQSGLLKQLKTAGLLDDKAWKALNVVISRIRAPIEIVVAGDVSMQAMPTVLLATQFDYPSTEALEADLAHVLNKPPFTIEPADGDSGVIRAEHVSQATSNYHYNPKTGRFLLALGNNPAQFADWLTREADKDASASPIARAESLIDDSGQGLLLVLKPTPALFAMLPISGRERAQLERLKINQTKEIALGFGVAAGVPKIKAYMDMPQAGLRQLLPAYPLPKAASYYGHLGGMASVSLPDDKTLQAMYDLSEGNGSNDYAKFKQDFQKQAGGIALDDILGVVGRAFTYVSDDNGGYVVTDAGFDAQAKTLVQALNDKGIAIKLEELEIDGKTLTHLDINSAFKDINLGASVPAEAKKLAAQMQLSMWSLSKHFYWLIEDDALYISELPQPLLARSQGKTGEAKPLADAYRIGQADGNATLLGGVLNTRNLSQKAYYQHLRLLLALSDLADVPVNINAYPTANQLDFARYGKIGFRIGNGEDSASQSANANANGLLSIEIASENGLMDGNSTAVMPAVAVTGILAAIAIPAYQDYVEKSQLVRVYVAASVLKPAIEARMANGTALADINSDLFAEEIANIKANAFISDIRVDKGTIRVDLDMNNWESSQLLLIPQTKDFGESGAVITDWTCDSSRIAPRLLPRGCY